MMWRAVLPGAVAVACGSPAPAPPPPRSPVPPVVAAIKPGCSAPRVVVAHPAIWGSAHAVDDHHVYFPVFVDPAGKRGHAIWRAPLAGDKAALVWAGPTGIFGRRLARAGDSVYASGERGTAFPEHSGFADVGVAWRIDVASGKATLVGDSFCTPDMLRVHAGFLYYREVCLGGTSVRLAREPLPAGTGSVIHVVERDLLDYAITSTTAYMLDGATGKPHKLLAWRIARAGHEDDPLETLLESDALRAIAADDAGVFVVDAKRVLVRSGTTWKPLATGLDLRQLELSSTHVYGRGESGIVRISRQTGAVDTIAPPVERLGAITVRDRSTGTGVYWTDGAWGNASSVMTAECR